MQQEEILDSNTERERKHIRAATGFLSGALLFQGVLVYLLQVVDRIGVWYIVCFLAVFCLLAVMVIGYLRLFLITLRKLEKIWMRYAFFTVLLVGVFVLHGITAAGCLADAVGGGRMVTTTEYRVYQQHLRFNDDGKDVVLTLPEDVMAQLRSMTNQEELILTDDCLFVHPDPVTVKYYPRIKVFLNINVSE